MNISPVPVPKIIEQEFLLMSAKLSDDMPPFDRAPTLILTGRPISLTQLKRLFAPPAVVSESG